MTGRTAAEDTRAQLLAALRHPNPYVRAGAALALGRLRVSTAVKPLIAALDDPVYAVQQGAARGLGLMGVQVVDQLLAQIRERKGPDLQSRMADALGWVRDPEAVDVLSAALNYLQPPARYGAAWALGAIGDARAVPALVQATRSDDPPSRHHAAQALLEIGAPEAVHALAALLGEADPRLRTLAVGGLGRIGGEQVVLSLLAALNDEDEGVRQEAADALQQVRQPELEDILLTALKTPAAFIQQTIAAVLANYPAPAVCGRLLELMNEQGDLQTRLVAAQSLARLGDERGTAMILRTLNAPNEETRRLAAVALGLTGDPRAVEPLLDSVHRLTFDPGTPRGRQLRRRTVVALARLGPPIVPRLADLLRTGDASIRSLAIDALLELGGEAVDPLVLILESRAPAAVRAEVARVLGRIGDPRAAETLKAVLREALIGPYLIVFFARLILDRTARLRIAAAAALGVMESQDSSTVLLSAARYDPDPRVRSEAEKALARTASPAVIARFAQVDPAATTNHALASGAVIMIAAFLAGTVSRVWGMQEAGLLAGLLAGGAIGFLDALEGRQALGRGVLLGCLAAVLAGFGLAGIGVQPWIVSAVGFALPAGCALAAWARSSLFLRLAGGFGGMVLGFLSAGIAALLFA